MSPADDQYGPKITTTHVGQPTQPSSEGGLPNTGLVLYPIVIVALALVAVGLILRMRERRER